MMSGDIESVLRVLKQFSQGYFTLTDEVGDQFVIARKEEFEGRRKRVGEEQLPLPATPSAEKDSADEVLDKINREIAMYQVQETQEDDDLGIRPTRKIQFEPLKGDLPPELQE